MEQVTVDCVGNMGLTTGGSPPTSDTEESCEYVVHGRNCKSSPIEVVDHAELKPAHTDRDILSVALK